MSNPSRRILRAGWLIAVSGCLALAAVELNHPTGSKGILLIDKLGAHLRFLDPVNYKEIANVETAANPHDFAISADHKTAFVPIYGDGVYGRNPHPGHEIDIVDLDQHKITGVIDIAPNRAPHGIQIDHDDLLYVTCDLDRRVLVVDPAKRTIVRSIDTEGTGHWIALVRQTGKLYVANKNDRLFISVLDVKTGKMIGKIPAPNGTQGIAASPDGTRVVAMDLKEPILIVIDPKTDQVTDRVALKNQTRGGYKVYFSPDGKQLLTMTEAGGLVNIFDARYIHGEQRVVTAGKDPMGFAFSPDGKTVLVANHGDGTVSVLDLPSARVTSNFHAGTGIETLSWY